MMPTAKKRINITAEPDIETALKQIARRDHMPVAAKAADLIRIALEIEEDAYFGKLAQERMKEKVKYLSHEQVWRE